MRLKIALFCLPLLVGLPLKAAVPDDCEEKLLAFETVVSEDKSVYDECGFNDSELVWNKWAPFASGKGAKKMLLEVCKRYPEHLYHDMYCNKAYRSGYAPAVAYKAMEYVNKGDIAKGIEEGTRALQTGELTKTEEGELLEAFAVHYLKENDERFKAYLGAAAERRSALANHISAILMYESMKGEDAGDSANGRDGQIINYIWRAILLGCPAAEEILGLYRLAQNKQLSYESALEQMKDKLFTCAPTEFEEVSVPIEEEMLDCRCKSVLDAEKRAREKPYLLKETKGDVAVLEDKYGQVYEVSEGASLPEQGSVSEIHKTGVVLLYPDDRVILNLYRANECTDFCNKYHIKENMSADAMRDFLTNRGPRVKPYHLTFSESDCENVAYYAKRLVDEELPYVGKTECGAPVQQPVAVIPLLQELENASKTKGALPQDNKKPVNQEDVLDRLNRMNGMF